MEGIDDSRVLRDRNVAAHRSRRALGVAVARERLVLAVQADGHTKVAARSREPWAPSGGMFDRDGILWLLKYDATNAVRVRRIGPNAQERIFSPRMPRQ